MVPTKAGGDLHAPAVEIAKYKNPEIPALRVASKDARGFTGFWDGQKNLFKSSKGTLH